MIGFVARRAAAVTAAVLGLSAFAAFAQTSAVQITSGPSVTENEITESSAVVRWQTNVESTTIVNFGTTAAFGQEFKKIVPIEETEITELSHSMTLWGLEPGTTYHYMVRSGAGGTTAQSAAFTFKTKSNACVADEWSCGEWASCAKGTDGTYAQSRVCTLKTDCPAAETPKPAESQTCTPACTDDTWECAAWNACSSTGSQSRVCALKTDCPAAETPKPAETQSCKPACTEDKWTCSEWGKCNAGERRRTCTMTEDCPTVNTPLPAWFEACTSTEPELLAEAQELQHSREQAEPLAVLPGDDDTQGEDDAPAPEPVVTSDLTPPPPITNSEGGGENVGGSFGLMGAAAVPVSVLSDECAANGILPERCAAWLEVKYADDSCEAAGVFTKESCEKFLTEKNGGAFPGCEGKTAEECEAVKSRATLGYLPEDEKKKVDDIITTKKVSEAFEELGAAAPLLVAVRIEKKDEVRWFRSEGSGGGETSPGVIVFDTDKDGVPDDVEKRLGTDPAKADSDGDGQPDGKVSRDVLKEFFEKGDRPAMSEEARDALEKFFESGDIPSAKVSRDILKSFFEKGDRPAMSAVDLGFLLGVPIDQPMSAGETEMTFGVTLESGAAATNREIIRCQSEKDCPPEYPFCRDGYCYGDGEDANAPAPMGYRTVNDDNKDVAKKTDKPLKPSNLLKGKATPNTTVVLYVYSYVPMVLTTTTDENGNFEYDLADNVVDGEHTVYVAVTDDTGKIAKKSDLRERRHRRDLRGGLPPSGRQRDDDRAARGLRAVLPVRHPRARVRRARFRLALRLPPEQGRRRNEGVRHPSARP
jgi:hypothetical protein